MTVTMRTLERHAREHRLMRQYGIARLPHHARGFRGIAGLIGEAGDDASTGSVYFNPLYRLVTAAAAGTAAYHGYKRNNSVGWAIWWGLMGGIFPVITIPVAFAQGFGKRK